MVKQFKLFRLLRILFVLAILTTNQKWPASAQSNDELSWSTPVNLSNSDLTSLPAIISDQNGIVHVVWHDDDTGSMYSQLLDGVWSQPVAVKSPFSNFAPQLFDGGDYIHAFWINVNNDTLNYSRVEYSKFGTDGGWEKAKVLAGGVKDFQVATQDDQTLHVAYMTSLENAKTSAGTYYLRSSDGGEKWDAAKPIYTSRYFRDLDAKLANVSIAATTQDERSTVYIVWNNPAIKRVFLSRSLDGGETWEDPFEVDGPTTTDTSSSPFIPIVTANNSDVLLLWQSNLQSGFACTLYSQSSNDNGNTWNERTRILDEFVGCPQDNVFLNTNQGFSLLQTTIRDEVYMLAWNGESWSKAYPQNTLSGFIDPLTNEPVVFRCRQSTLQSGTTIFVVGCNESDNQDVWVTSRAIGTIDDWFPSTQLWSDPVLVTESENEISSVQTIADLHGAFHIFWRQVDKVEATGTQRSINYARYDHNLLSQPSRILSAPDKMVEDFSIAYDRSRDRLAVVWTSTTTGEIYFSWADISRATSTFEWSKAVILQPVHPLFDSPNILITPDGTIYVAYAVPVNEDRGIYLVSSTDGGETWGETTLVYGVSEPNWQMIDFPAMSSSGDEIIQMIWRREKIIGEVGVVGLYYAQSKDRGQTWSTPQVVSNNQIRGAWIIDGATQGVHRFWLSVIGTESSFFHDTSIDQGANWTIQDNLTRLGETPGVAQPYVDSNGWVNFTQAVEYAPGKLEINHQQNNQGSWQILDSLELGNGSIPGVTSLGSQALQDGRLALAYSFNESQPQMDEKPYRLYFAVQNESPLKATQAVIAHPETPVALTVIPEPTLNATEPISTAIPTQTVIPQTPEINQIAAAPEVQTFPVDNTTGFVLGGGLAVLVVLVFFVFTRLRRL